ncbi:hypothetical protein [Actinokineospora iranica]|uniref:Uncharacterized protein n=1 Tax=Actinokineospora iranica TaxID=1271860 RepID=A0A1G6UCA7_9PSEU|nr:hypothetical protein [Actinokineospora iranica]SDD39008.1 hypothetical protein SAMN05216174_110208 [Actinokineospora iranica]
MTAIPDDSGTPALVLICDGCGRSRRGERARPEAWLLLWSQAGGAGWRGRDRAIGPHFCPLCATP